MILVLALMETVQTFPMDLRVIVRLGTSGLYVKMILMIALVTFAGTMQLVTISLITICANVHQTGLEISVKLQLTIVKIFLV